MNIILYLILIITPLPLFYLSYRHKHYLYCVLPLMALFGIYLFDIIGSIEVIRDERLFSDMYYYSLLLIIVLFYLFYMVVFSFKSKLYIDWSVTHSTRADSLKLLLMAFWSYSFFMLYLYYQRHGLPAIFHISLFNYYDIYAIRAEKSTSLPEGMHWYRVGWGYIPQFIFVYTYILKKIHKSRKYKKLFYINLPLVLFFSSLTLSKSVYMYLLLSVFLVNLLIKGRQFDFKKIYHYIFGGTVTIFLMIRLYLLDRGFVDVFKLFPYFLYRRICISYTKAHAYIIQIFPDQHDFLYGTAFFPNPRHVFQFEPVNLSQFLGDWVHGILQNYSAPSFSQGYANFGFLGFMLIILMMFFQIILLQIVFKICPKNPLFLALYVLIIPKMLGYGNQGIWGIVSEIFVLFCIALVFTYYFSRGVASGLGQGKRAVKLRRPQLIGRQV